MDFVCPHCQQSLEVDDTYAGATLNCPACGKPIVIETGQAVEGQPSGASSASKTQQETGAHPATEATFLPPLERDAPSQHGGEAKKKVVCPHCFAVCEVPGSSMELYVDCPSCEKRFRPHQERTTDGDGHPEKLPFTVACVFQGIVLLLMGISNIIYFGKMYDLSDVMAWVFPVVFISELVFSFRLHYKCWVAIPQSFARTTPGKAVGHLFIPIYNLYWLFPSIAGLGDDCVNLGKKQGFTGVKHLRALGMTLAIVMCVGLLNCGLLWTSLAAATVEDAAALGFNAESEVPFLLFISSMGGFPVVGLFLALAKFVIWVLFYRGVTRLLQKTSATEPAAPRHRKIAINFNK